MIKVFTTICAFLLLVSGCMAHEAMKSSKETEDYEEAMEMQVVEIVNRERAKLNLSPLLIDESLMKSCDTRAKELVEKYSHDRPNGESFLTIITMPYRSAGENIAYGQKDAQVIMSSWMNSEGHRENILFEGYTHIGVGCYKKNNTLYWVQLFIQKR